MIPHDYETGAGLLGAFTLKDPNPTGASPGVPGTPGISTYYGVVFQPSFGFLFFRNRFDNFNPNESDRVAYKRFQGRFGFYSQDPIAGVSDAVLSASGIAYNPLTGYWIGNTDDGVDSVKNYTALLSHLPDNAIEVNADNRNTTMKAVANVGPAIYAMYFDENPVDPVYKIKVFGSETAIVSAPATAPSQTAELPIPFQARTQYFSLKKFEKKLDVVRVGIRGAFTVTHLNQNAIIQTSTSLAESAGSDLTLADKLSNYVIVFKQTLPDVEVGDYIFPHAGLDATLPTTLPNAFFEVVGFEIVSDKEQVLHCRSVEL